jgi:hypothetical protein|tara:strand:- start:78 stop:917 length:840 start_codon:yes stop_codon:yes gene_type:complete
MAKKQTRSTNTRKVVVEQNQEMVLEEPVVVKTKTQKPKKDDWEITDRVYYLMGNKKPISRMIKSANLYWFDEEKGYEREIKYCENQKTPFVDEMKGDQRLSHIVFRNGAFYVEKTKTVLQKFLSLYHPENGSLFYEFEPVKEAVNEIERLELEADAILAARNMDIDMAEAVMRVELGSKVSEMSSKELKRDLLLFARNNPDLLLELINDDNVQLRNYGIKATELGIIKLSNDQRTFKWGSNDRKLMTVPFDEHPYSALAAWFKTDEGMEIYSNIEKQIK